MAWDTLDHVGVVARAGPLKVSDVQTAGTVSATNAISRILIRAGLAGLPDVRPGSVTAWAGKRCMDETGDIAAVARLLGVPCLDVAARKIGWNWDK